MLNYEMEPDPVELDKNFLESSYPAGTLSGLICPDCGGALWEIHKGTLRRFQCHVGHAFSIESFLEGQAEEIEHMLWASLRTMKERMKIIDQMADEARDNNQPLRSQILKEQAQQTLHRAELIRQALLEGESSPLDRAES